MKDKFMVDSQKIVAGLAEAVRLAATPEDLRIALGNLTNASVRLGYAAFLASGDHPDFESARHYVDVVGGK